MEKGNSSGEMDQCTLVILLIIIFKDMVFIYGRIRGVMMESGRIIKWKEKEHLLGLIIGRMLESIKMIKKMGMGFLNGVTDGSIKVFGKMGNNMEKVNFIFQRRRNGKAVYGRMENAFNGWIINNKYNNVKYFVI